MTQRKGGFVRVQVNGVGYDAKGDASYNLGRPKRDPIVGSDAVHGFKETPQPASLELKFTDRSDLDLNALVGEVLALYGAALCFLLVGLVLVGVALLFCAAVPSSEYPAARTVRITSAAPSM